MHIFHFEFCLLLFPYILTSSDPDEWYLRKWSTLLYCVTIYDKIVDFIPWEVPIFQFSGIREAIDNVCLFYDKGWILLAQGQCSYNKDYSEDLDVDYRIILKCIASRLQGWKFQGSNLDRGLRFFSFPKRPNWLFGQPSVLFNGYRDYFLGVQWPELEVNPLPPTGEVKNEWGYTSTPPICLRGVHREYFTFFNLNLGKGAAEAVKARTLNREVSCSHIWEQP